MIGGLNVSCCEAVTADNMLVNHMNSKNQSSIIVQPFSRWLSRIGFLSSHRCTTGILIAFLLSLLFVPASSNLLADESSTGPVELVLTLNSAIELALERNPGLLEQRLAREAQRFKLGIDLDQYRPKFTINSGASLGRGMDNTADVGLSATLRVPTGGSFTLTSPKILSDEEPGDPKLEFVQPLLQGAVDNSLTTVRLSEKLAILEFKKTVSDAVDSTIRAYRGLNKALRNVEIAEASLQRARQQLEVSRALIQAGRIARREITRSEATVANRELALIRTQNALDTENYKLINMLDLDSFTRIRPQENLGGDQIHRVENGEIDVQKSIATALRNRTEHLRDIVKVEEAEIGLREARNKELPNLKLTLSVTHLESKSRNNHSARLSFSIPLDNRTKKHSTMLAENTLISAQRNLEERRESIGIEVRQAIIDVEVGYRVMELAGAARQLAEENLEIEQDKFNQGLSSTFEVSASEEELVTAQNNETDRVIDYLDALIRLDTAMGQTLETWGIEVEEVPQ